MPKASIGVKKKNPRRPRRPGARWRSLSYRQVTPRLPGQPELEESSDDEMKTAMAITVTG